MSNIITVIAYKANAIDSCRGCVMDTYDSDLQMFSSDDPAKVLEFVANLRVSDLDHYSSYELTFIVNGRCVNYQGNSPDEDFIEELDYDMYQQYEKIIYDLIAQVDDRVSILVTQRNKAAKREQLRKQQAAIRSQEIQERKQYEQLRAKFEGDKR